ncbi:DNA repair protein RAD51 homolog 4-like [Ochlerotatus camptorhynchus]|uniref:DNA repair protein RAD51 homolog 4-like n=1 Tax=Ochlerotatus camptorhynchus TaxID=644619 RepID=UPI0031DFE57F
MTSVTLSSEIHPELTEYVVKLMLKNRINTVFDFAKAEDDRLMRITNLSYEDVSAIKKDIILQFSGNSIQVVEYFQYLEEMVEPLRTGIRGLDLLIEGGLLPGHVMEICGESSSGKTQMCTTMAANIALKHKLDVFYVDTKCDFSAHRVQKVLQLNKCSDDEMKEAMARIKVERIFSPEGLICAMEDLLVKVDDWEKFKVLIIDSLPPLWYLHQNSKSMCYPLGMLTRLIGLLRKLASENLISVVLVNLKIASSDSYALGGGSKRIINQRESSAYPALGRFWETAPTTRILMSKIEGNDTGQERLLTIWKCSFLKCGDRQMVTLTDAGVV